MRKILSLTLAVLILVTAFALPAFAEEVVTDEPITVETVTEYVTVPAEEVVTEAETEITTEISEVTETETAVPFDEWLYGLMQEASPEQMDMIEDIVLGGVGALDKLGIKGFDRVRVWVEHNMATVMVAALIVALVCFFVASLIQKKGLFKKCDILNNNAIEIYEAGQEAIAKSEKVCNASVKAAEEAAHNSSLAVSMVAEERAMLIAEIDKNARVNAAMCETINFLLQCSDLSQAKRHEAEEIFKKGLEAMNHDHTDEA